MSAIAPLNSLVAPVAAIVAAVCRRVTFCSAVSSLAFFMVCAVEAFMAMAVASICAFNSRSRAIKVEFSRESCAR